MKIGDWVKSKDDDTYGRVEWSMMGFQIHFWNEEFGCYGKTLGESEYVLSKEWEVVEKLPDTYELNDYRLPVRK